MLGVRNCSGERPLGRVGGVFVVGLRWARRKGEGESLANVSREKESADGAVAMAIVWCAACCEVYCSCGVVVEESRGGCRDLKFTGSFALFGRDAWPCVCRRHFPGSEVDLVVLIDLELRSR